MLVWIFVFFIKFSGAQEPVKSVMVKAPPADLQEFQVHTQLQESTPISQWQRQCSQSDFLRDQLKAAQFHFLNGSLKQAQNIFRKITEIKWGCDWTAEERQAIHYAYMRLTQMSESEPEQIRLLTDALGFDETLQPDTQLIPPPVVELFRKIQAQVGKIQIITPPLLRKYGSILRNGKVISTQSQFIEALPLRARYTLVSDSFKNETLVITMAELEKLNLNPEPWVRGDCEKYTLANELRSVSAPLKIYFNKNCIVDLSAQNSDSPSFSEEVLKRHQAEFATEGSLPRRKNWIQRNYLWVGASVIASAILMAQLNKGRDSSSSPTATFTPEPAAAP